MPLVNQISALATRMGTECKSIRASIGSLASLTTTEKATIVGAINEVKAAVGAGGSITAASITDATATGRSLLTTASAAAARTTLGATTVGGNVFVAADAAAARTAIGAGTSSLALGTTASTAKAGNWLPTAADVSDATAIGRTVLKAADAAAVRSAIGAIDAAAVDTRINTLVGAAPAALDTLQELSAALGGDANFAGTVTAALANRVAVDAAQAFTAPQQAQARANIGAVAAADIGNTETDFVAIFNAAL